MKYLLVLAVVAVAFWVWRNNRQTTKADKKVPPTKEPMLQCATCGVHLPAADAITGRRGSYCSPAHQQQLED
jgi:uncharacterized protein